MWAIFLSCLFVMVLILVLICFLRLVFFDLRLVFCYRDLVLFLVRFGGVYDDLILCRLG